MNLNHLHLHVASVERSAAFYERCFGLVPHARHGDILFLRDEAGMDLALAPGEVAALPGWFHFGFRLESKAAVEALSGGVQAAGATLLAPYADWGDLASFRCADPDGYAIEVYWEPQPGPG